MIWPLKSTVVIADPVNLDDLTSHVTATMPEHVLYPIDGYAHVEGGSRWKSSACATLEIIAG